MKDLKGVAMTDSGTNLSLDMKMELKLSNNVKWYLLGEKRNARIRIIIIFCTNFFQKPPHSMQSLPINRSETFVFKRRTVILHVVANTKLENHLAILTRAKSGCNSIYLFFSFTITIVFLGWRWRNVLKWGKMCPNQRFQKTAKSFTASVQHRMEKMRTQNQWWKNIEN